MGEHSYLEPDAVPASRASREQSIRDQRFGKKQRLTRSGQFRETYAQGRRWTGRSMVLWLRAGEGASMRLGVVASRKVGDAVRRARAKRRLREVFRLHRHRFHGSFDVVLVARSALLSAPWSEVAGELLALAGQAGIVKKDPAS